MEQANMYKNYLAHHGIKGQKWGVRNGPPYPIEDKVMAKGTRLKTVSPYKNPEQKGRWLYTYNANDEWDAKVYEGPFSVYLKQGRNYTNLAIHEFETTKDLKMPTSKERQEGLKQIWQNANKKQKKQYLKEAERFKRDMMFYNWGMDKEANKHLKDLNLHKEKLNEKDFKLFYYMFNSMMEESEAYSLTKDYKKYMSENYDAMVDDNNVNIYNRAHDPVIIFKTEEALKRVGNYKILTNDEIKKKHDEVQKELEKHGERVKY